MGIDNGNISIPTANYSWLLINNDLPVFSIVPEHLKVLLATSEFRILNIHKLILKNQSRIVDPFVGEYLLVFSRLSFLSLNRIIKNDIA